MKLVIILVAVAINLSAMSFDNDFVVSAKIQKPSVLIKTNTGDVQADKEVATVTDDWKPSVAIGIATQDKYFSDGNSNFGYFFKVDLNTFEATKQEYKINYTFGHETVENDIGTSIRGYNAFVVPTIFYNFNKNSSNFQYKTGIGVGAGYTSMNGDFIITDMSHPKYNQKQSVDVNGLGMSVGIYLEATKKQHSFIVQNYGTTSKDKNYTYSTMHLEVVYQYKF